MTPEQKEAVAFLLQLSKEVHLSIKQGDLGEARSRIDQLTVHMEEYLLEWEDE